MNTTNIQNEEQNKNKEQNQDALMVRFNDGKFIRVAKINRYSDTNGLYIEFSKGLLTSKWTQYVTLNLSKDLKILRIISERIGDNLSSQDEKLIEFQADNALNVFSSYIEELKAISKMDDIVIKQKSILDIIDKVFSEFYSFEEQEEY